MGKKTKSTIKQCVYCGQTKATTRDHVVSRNLFPEGFEKKNLITVPCCRGCNQGFSVDEEYFRIFLVNITADNSKPAGELFNSKIRDSILRRPQLGHKIMSNMELVEAYSRSGLYLGKKTRIHITEDDWARYYRVLDKYVRGLFFKEFKERLPDNYMIKHFFGNEETREQLLMLNKWNTDNHDVFFYGFNFVPKDFRSVWGTVFFNWSFFISFCSATIKIPA